jgi:hypothetical protein
VVAAVELLQLVQVLCIIKILALVILVHSSAQCTVLISVPGCTVHTVLVQWAIIFLCAIPPGSVSGLKIYAQKLKSPRLFLKKNVITSQHTVLQQRIIINKIPNISL